MNKTDDKELTIILNNSSVFVDWSLGIQHFSLGLYRALLEKIPETNWRLVVPTRQKVRYQAKLSGANLSYYEQQRIVSLLCSQFIRQPLKLIKYSWTLLKKDRDNNDLYTQSGVQNFWWEKVERGAFLEYCPSQVTPVHSRLPLVLTCHDLHPWNVPWQYSDPEGLKSIVADNLQKAKAIIVSWPHPFQEVSERFPQHRGKMFMIPLPVLVGRRIVDRKEAVNVKNRFNLHGRFLLYASRLQPHKNHRTLLFAFATVRNKIKDLFLVCPGSAWTEEFRNELLQICKDLGISNYVYFPGYVSTEDLQVLYTMCDAVVVPTLAEATSGTMLEGFLYGKPVACSAIPPLKTFIEWVGGDVCFFDPESPQDMASAIIEVLENQEPYRLGSLKAGNRLKTFNWSRTAEQYRDVFHWVLNGCKPWLRPEWANKPVTF